MKVNNVAIQEAVELDASELVKERLELKERYDVAQTLLLKLSFDQKTCIVLREIEGLSYEEISKVLNININTVRSRLKRARQALMAMSKNEVVANEL